MLVSIILLIVLIGINGIFSASELAFLSMDKFSLSEDVKNHNKKAKKVEKILEDSSQFLSTIQIGITLAGFFASAFAADYFADYFLRIINISFISKSILELILVILITIVLSYFTLVFGELVPKRIAMNNPKNISYMFVDLIIIVKKLFYPLIKILSLSTEIVCNIFRIKDKEDKLTEEDIKKMIILGNTEGVVEEKEKEYILNIFEFNDIDVTNVMTLKKDVHLLNIDDSLVDSLSIIKKYKHTRFPVYKKSTNNIIGIVNVKDLIMRHKNNSINSLYDILRPIKKINQNEKIDDIFRMMQEKKESICIVYNKDKFVGIVTLEDAIEEIVGNIYDEFDNLK